jgi:hypothetical protein
MDERRAERTPEDLLLRVTRVDVWPPKKSDLVRADEHPIELALELDGPSDCYVPRRRRNGEQRLAPGGACVKRMVAWTL